MGGGITGRARFSETFFFDVEKSFGRVKSQGLFLVTYGLIQRVVERPARACFAAPRCWWLIPLGAVSFPSRGRDADFTSLQYSETNREPFFKVLLLFLMQHLFLLHGGMFLSAVQACEKLCSPTRLTPF